MWPQVTGLAAFLGLAAGMTFGATSSPTGKRKYQLTINFQETL
jgi:hypothetical protein